MTSKDLTNRLISIGSAVAAGLCVELLVHQPFLALAAFCATGFIALTLVSRQFPVRFSFDRSYRVLLGASGCYKSQEEAGPAIIAAAHASRRLDIALIRGHTFILDSDSLLSRMLARALNVEVRLLLLHPEGKAMSSYLSKMKIVNQDRDAYLAKCALVRRTLDDVKARCRLTYKYYDYFPSWKVIITDSHAFVAPYDTRTRGSELTYVAFQNMGRPFFVAFANHFEQVWQKLALHK